MANPQILSSTFLIHLKPIKQNSYIQLIVNDLTSYIFGKAAKFMNIN